MEIDAISQKGKGKGKSGKGKKGAKVTVKRQQSTRDSRVNVETAESTDTKLLTLGTSSRPNLKAKTKGTGKSKSKVTEISKSDSSKQVEETWTPNTCAQPSSSSQVNTIGCHHEGLWIISLEDSKKRRHAVRWGNQSDCKSEEHELMMFWTCLPTLVCTAISNGEFYKR